MKLALAQLYNSWRAYPGQLRLLEATPDGNTILITGPYRSGTSWVGQMLASAGVWHLHEPFNPHHGIWPDYFSYRRSDREDGRLDAMVTALSSGRLVESSGHVFLRGIRANRFGMPARLGLFDGRLRRVLIKDPIACLLSEYLVRNHGMTAVLVLRHPAGFASSLENLGWDTANRLRGLLSDETLMAD